jgi:hypothetical protein
MNMTLYISTMAEWKTAVMGSTIILFSTRKYRLLLALKQD